MKSTIEDTLSRQDDRAYREKITNQMVQQLDFCPDGQRHHWRLMQWTETNESNPIWVAGVMAPVCYERGPVHSTAKMTCACGASVDYKSSAFA